MAGNTTLRRFIQEVLGCGCPEEVFRSIDESVLQWNGVQGRRVSVGGRLLIAVLQTDDPEVVRAGLAQWVELGRQERDAGGMNRLRIVIASDRPQALEPMAQAVFSRTPGRDERVHLHLVERSACPWDAAQPVQHGCDTTKAADNSRTAEARTR